MPEVFKAIWNNGATIRVSYFEDPIEGEVESDCIQLHVQQEDGKERGWLMNVQDATDIIYGLSKAMSIAIEDERKIHS